MDMVGHQAKGVNRVSVLAAVFGQPLEICLIAGIGGKRLLSLIAANDLDLQQVSVRAALNTLNDLNKAQR
jgi:hypothetical protein